MLTVLKKITPRHPILLWGLHWLSILSVCLLLGIFSTSWSRTTGTMEIDPVTNDHDLCYTFLDTLFYCLLGGILKLLLNHRHRFTTIGVLPFILTVLLGVPLGASRIIVNLFCILGSCTVINCTVINWFSTLGHLGYGLFFCSLIIVPFLLIGVGATHVLQRWQQTQLSFTYRCLFCLGLLIPLLANSVLLFRCLTGICLLGFSSVAALIDGVYLGCGGRPVYLSSFILLWPAWMVIVGSKALLKAIVTGSGSPIRAC